MYWWVSEEYSVKETSNVFVPTVQVDETADKVEAKDTTVAEEAAIKKVIKSKSESNVAESANNPGIEVDEEFAEINHLKPSQTQPFLICHCSSCCTYKKTKRGRLINVSIRLRMKRKWQFFLPR